jgi:hypothetical protein
MTYAQLFTADAHLVDCEPVRLRKAEVQLFSPADLKKIFGPAALDESNAPTPLKELLISRSWLSASSVESVCAETNIPSEKLSRRAGRPALGVEDQRFYKIGCSVEQEFPRCERGFELRRKFTNGGILDLNTLQKEMKKERFSEVEIESALSMDSCLLSGGREPKSRSKEVIRASVLSASRFAPARKSAQIISNMYPRDLSLPSIRAAVSRACSITASRNSSAAFFRSSIKRL